MVILMTVIFKHLPALQVLIPFFGALLTAISNVKNAKIIAIISIISATVLGVYGVYIVDDTLYYAFGNWQAPIGIEYRLDRLSQPIILYINCVLLLFLLFCYYLAKGAILNFIQEQRQNLFYSLLLFVHTGYIGMVSTNDLFNLYVFIEISSLSTYVLMSQGNHKRSAVGAFDYLVLGSIGATLILISIGFLLSCTGSLNINDIKQLLSNQYNSKIVIIAISFFLIGAILKIACFPMHFWMIRAYLSAPSIILMYLASISSIIGIYIILRFIHFVLDYTQIAISLNILIGYVAITVILICSWLALKSKLIKKTIIYSTSTQIGYILLLLSIENSTTVLLQMLFVDSVNKIGLFLLMAHVENIIITNYQHKVESNNVAVYVSILILIASAGLPITSMFFVKIKLFELLFTNQLLLQFCIVIISSAIGLLYHYQIAQKLFYNNISIFTHTRFYGMYVILMLQFVSLIIISNDDLWNFMNILK